MSGRACSSKSVAGAAFALLLTAAAAVGCVAAATPCAAVLAAEQPSAPATTAPASAAIRQWDAELAGEPVVDKDSKHKMVRLMRGLKRELAADADDTGKDMVFVFSARDIDPYDKKPPKDKPYTFATFSLVDGTTAKLVKYPDGSGRIFGGYADGTVLIPTGNRQWQVKYPNGAQGKLFELSENTLKLERPDNTVTTFTRQPDGSFRIANDQIGYMGEVNPEETGFRFQLNLKPLN